MGKLRNRRTEMELNETLRLQTLRCILEARSTEYMADKFGVTEKAIKFRLTNLYKFYQVRSKYELMAKFIELPDEVLLSDIKDEDYTLNNPEEGESVELKEPLTKEDTLTLNTLPTGKTNSIWS